MKYDPGTPTPIWRVGEFRSSADPRRYVLMLATGQDEIRDYGGRRDFIRWVSPEEALQTMAPKLLKSAPKAPGCWIDQQENLYKLEPTVAAEWRTKGERDPHEGHYNQPREQLALGDMTDDSLANGAFMNYDNFDIQKVLTRTPGYHPPIVWMTAVKDRLRWLSRRLVAAEQAAEVVVTSAGWAQLKIRGVCVASGYGEEEKQRLEAKAAEVNTGAKP